MRSPFVLLLGLILCASASAQGTRPSILLVGYLPPTNEMLREFSTNPNQNPGLWAGGNWEERGYNVFAYFPEFPIGSQCMGVGDFEIDYQDTTADFIRITQQLHPVAILTFSVAATNLGWGLEPAYQRWRLPYEMITPGSRPISTYLADCTGLRYPYFSPILADRVGHVRLSNLPMQAIAASVAGSLPSTSIQPFVYPYVPGSAAPDSFCGNYLSGYVAYLAAMYRERFQPPAATTPCYLSGHIHVGHSVQPAVGTIATEITLRKAISTLNLMSDAIQSAGGACCEPDGGSCMVALASSCSGLFLGPSSSCGPWVCPAVPTGSCCLIDGTCTIAPHFECDDGPRVWTGGGFCSPRSCVVGPPGVCCRGATCNTIIGPANCSSNGAAAGAFYSLLSDACDPPAGQPRPCCHADYNKSGFVTTLDILDYLRDWLDASSFARIGSDGAPGTPDIDDLFAFLNAWFIACP